MRKTIVKSTERVPGAVGGSVYVSAVLQRRELRTALRRAREEKKTLVAALDSAAEALGEAIYHLEMRHPDLSVGWRAALDEIKAAQRAAGRGGKVRP